MLVITIHTLSIIDSYFLFCIFLSAQEVSIWCSPSDNQNVHLHLSLLKDQGSPYCLNCMICNSTFFFKFLQENCLFTFKTNLQYLSLHINWSWWSGLFWVVQAENLGLLQKELAHGASVPSVLTLRWHTSPVIKPRYILLLLSGWRLIFWVVMAFSPGPRSQRAHEHLPGISRLPGSLSLGSLVMFLPVAEASFWTAAEVVQSLRPSSTSNAIIWQFDKLHILRGCKGRNPDPLVNVLTQKSWLGLELAGTHDIAEFTQTHWYNHQEQQDRTR